MQKNRVNREIKSNTVFLIGPDGEKIGEITLNEAMNLASNHGLDLVEVSNSNESICKIMDWKKELYERSKKEKQAKRASQLLHNTLKEIRFSCKIEKHDLDTKVKQITRLVKAGHKVLVVVQLKGREISRPQLALDVIDDVISLLGNEYSHSPIKNQGRDRSTIIELQK